ncbi:MAG: YeeE/YedE family protein [Proteobacteria bacterium]|nr:YeeE/YedE family protein [Pseudomonadota bacterium]
MDLNAALYGLAGGVLIGASAGALLVFNGRIAGISGIYGGLLNKSRLASGDGTWRLVFVAGLIAGGLLLRLLHPESLPIEYEAEGGWAILILAGLLVGFGTRLGSGCTSGHGVCGMSRLSRRSLVATPLFIAVAMLTVLATAPLFVGG